MGPLVAAAVSGLASGAVSAGASALMGGGGGGLSEGTQLVAAREAQNGVNAAQDYLNSMRPYSQDLNAIGQNVLGGYLPYGHQFLQGSLSSASGANFFQPQVSGTPSFGLQANSAPTPNSALLMNLSGEAYSNRNASQQLSGHYLGSVAPTVAQMNEQARAFNSAAYSDQMRSRAAADFAQSHAQAQAGIDRQLAAMGAGNPSSGAAMALRQQAATQMAAQRAAAMTNAAFSAEQMGFDRLGQAAEAGKGLGTLGTQYGQLAGQLYGTSADLDATRMNQATGLAQSQLSAMSSMYGSDRSYDASAGTRNYYNMQAAMMPAEFYRDSLVTSAGLLGSGYDQVGGAIGNYVTGATGVVSSQAGLAGQQARATQPEWMTSAAGGIGDAAGDLVNDWLTRTPSATA